jgi:hypothetical protein
MPVLSDRKRHLKPGSATLCAVPLPPGFDLSDRPGAQVVISNFRRPGQGSVADLLRSAAKVADNLKFQPDPETGETTEREVIIDALAARTDDTGDGPLHSIVLHYHFVDDGEQ